MPSGRSYTIPCASAFRDRVIALAAKRGASVADLARAVLLLVSPAILAGVADPGEPARGDREEIVLKTGAGKDRRLRRKPRLQVRLTGEHAITDLRRALGLALALADGRLQLRLEPTGDEAERPREEEAARLQQTVRALAFEPLTEDIRSRSEALYVLGFPPWAAPNPVQLRTRFRALATVYHPDNLTGDTLRMAQLNAAIAFLSRS
jgi:transposase-like protein